jgi:hypothetical protein
MHEEEERRKEHEAAVQRAVRTELEIHRHQEILQRQHEMEVGSAVSSYYQRERRRILMAQKASATNIARGISQEHGRFQQVINNHQNWRRDDPEPTTRHGDDHAGQFPRDLGTKGYDHADCNSISSTFTKPSSFDQKGGLLSHTTGNNCVGTRGSLFEMKQGSELSSLFDGSLDEEDFEDIAIE